MIRLPKAARSSREVLVLCYHAVSPTWNAALSVTPAALEGQLTALTRRGFRGATFTEAVLDPPHPRTLAVTFDDGYLSVLERAAPILRKLELPGTVFAPTDFMGQRQPLAWNGTRQWAATASAGELQGMSWQDLRSLSASGWEIGSHTRTHPRLTRLSQGAAYEELVESRVECEKRLGATCTAIAYPYGDVNEMVANTAGEAGYLAAACLSSSLAPRGPLQWPRVGIYHGDASWRFHLKANIWMRRLRATSLWPVHE